MQKAAALTASSCVSVVIPFLRDVLRTLVGYGRLLRCLARFLELRWIRRPGRFPGLARIVVHDARQHALRLAAHYREGAVDLAFRAAIAHAVDVPEDKMDLAR